MAEKPTALYVMMFDVEPEFDAEFNRWFNEEHLPERMGCPGFLRAMRFRAEPGAAGGPNPNAATPTYMTVYELQSPEVMRSEAYQALRARRTEWALRMLPKAKQWLRRTYIEVHPDRRPGGLLPMPYPRRLLVVTLDIPSDTAERLATWYDEDDGLAAASGGPVMSHLARMMTGPGVVSAVRFTADPAENAQATGGVVAPEYFTLYEINSSYGPRPQAPATDATRAATPAFTVPIRGMYTEMQPEMTSGS